MTEATEGERRAASAPITLWRKLRRRLSPFLVAAIVALACYLMYRTLREYSYAEIVEAVRQVPLARLGTAGAFAAGSYFCLTWSDFLATRFAGHKFPYPRVALTSFLALSIGHSIGFAALSSGAIRYRFYARWGMSVADNARVIVFCGLTVAFGLLALAGLAFLFDPDLTRDVTRLGGTATFALGAACVAITLCYPLAGLFLNRPTSLFGHRIELPKPSLAAMQVAVGATNFALVGGCLHQTMIAVSDVPYVTATVAYVLANLGILITHVPGGLGVIETVVTTAIPQSGLIGALLVFRFVYFLVPLLLGGALFLGAEATIRLRGAARRAPEGRS